MIGRCSEWRRMPWNWTGLWAPTGRVLTFIVPLILIPDEWTPRPFVTIALVGLSVIWMNAAARAWARQVQRRNEHRRSGDYGPLWPGLRDASLDSMNPRLSARFDQFNAHMSSGAEKNKLDLSNPEVLVALTWGSLITKLIAEGSGDVEGLGVERSQTFVTAWAARMASTRVPE